MIKTKYATSGTIEGIERMINQFYYSTTFKVDPVTFEISNKNGVISSGVMVEYKKKRFIFGY